MPTASIRLYDPYALGVAYTGRWVLTLSSFTTDPLSDGNINELDVPVTVYPGSGSYAAGFPLYFLFIGNDGTGDPTNFTGGVVIDSDALPAWVTYQAWNYSDNSSTWSTSTSTVQYYDGAWDGLFDLGIPVTVDPLSDPSWLPPVPPPPYEVVVVAQDGTPFGTLADARLARVSWELNGPGAAEVSLATTDTDADLLLPGREVQIYYQGGTDPIWWGPIVRPQGGLRESTWQCAGLLWYFAHRFMGRADRVNQLTNGGFESSETGWSFTGVTHSVNTDMTYVYEGSKSEKLTGAAADHDTYAYQTWTHPGGGYPGGDFLTGSVYVWISAADYVGPALEERGLFLRHHRADGSVVTGGDKDSGLPALINDDTPRDQWVHLETGVSFVQEGDTVDFLLFPPDGVAYFDLATLTYMESLSFGYPDTPADVVDIVAGIVDYAQDRGAFVHGKSDLNIDPGGTATGVLRQIAYQFAEHRNILDAILEYVRQGICDIDMLITATTRTLYVYPKSDDGRTPPFGKGSLYGTTLELDVNVADFSWSQDLEQAASSVVLLGPGDGPDRPEGVATDTSLLGGAFTLEIVEQAPDNTTVGQLDDRAAERLAVAARPEILDVTTLPGAGVIGNLLVGDTVPVLISNGWVDIDATYRVARIEADLVKDQATFTLNAIPT